VESLVEFLRGFWGIWLMLIFAGIVVWTFWPSRRKELEQQSRIPFKDDEG
jgi:cytochrome c oxidase cbb3-type subunit 4